MTDKNEERIYIEVIEENPCKKCERYDDDSCDCWDASFYIAGKTREELIDCMAEAMLLFCPYTIVSEQQKEAVYEGMKIYAEAALRAVLKKVN